MLGSRQGGNLSQNWCCTVRCVVTFHGLVCVFTDMQEKAKARLRELAPPQPEGARRRDSRNLAVDFSFMSVQPRASASSSDSILRCRLPSFLPRIASLRCPRS